MIQLSLSEVASATKGQLIGDDADFSGVSIDTRTLVQNNLYVAIKGESVDGHEYISQAIKAGASAVMVEHQVDVSVPQIIVEDTTKALGALAKYWRQQFTIPFIGLTGSCGKTSTKQMLAAICQQVGNTLYSTGNQNNQFGVPLTLFRLDENVEYAVIEMGTDRPGEIAYLTDIVEPQVALITNIAAVHIAKTGRFDSVDKIFTEKSNIFSHLPNNGCAILNADDAYYPQWCERLSQVNRISFGLQSKADVSATDLSHNADLQYSFSLQTPVGSTDVHLSTIGKHNVENALAASAACIAIGLSLDDITTGLANIELVDRRLIRYHAVNDASVIDDSYNANVKSVPAVIEMLAQYPGKRIMVLGDMGEVGPTSQAEHARMGQLAKDLGIDSFYAYGEETQYSISAFGDNGFHFDSHEALSEQLIKQLNPHTTVLVKGSNGMMMYKIVEAIRIQD
tara:strand:+ start:23923 stop:25281 length:1359 start_codon:yes stop_codon:yes gene_type:complete